MQRESFLRVLKLEEEEQEEFFIDIETKPSEEIFFENLQKIDDNICIITDNISLARKVWELNANSSIPQKSAVAMRVINKETVVPFY